MGKNNKESRLKDESRDARFMRMRLEKSEKLYREYYESMPEQERELMPKP